MGDIVLTTDNEYFIKGAHKDHNIITYEKGLAVPAKMTVANITKTVAKGFGTGVGGFSNVATILYAMAPMFDKPGREEQHAEIMMRIKLLREIVGQEIDRIKGADKPSLPPEWRKMERILPTDSQDEILRKLRRNSMVIQKKPYFFRYIYPALNQKFKEFEASYNQVCRDTFGIKLKKLMTMSDITEEQRALLKRYQKFSPLLTTQCTMNRLCRMIEDIDFDIRFTRDRDGNRRPAPHSMLPTFEAECADSYDPTKFMVVQEMYRTYSSRRSVAAITALNDITYSNPGIHAEDIYEEYHRTSYDALITSLQTRLQDASITGEEFLFYCNRLAPRYKSFNWGFAWAVLGEQIVRLIPRGRSYCPIQDPDGEYTYLGLNYSLKDLSPDIDIDAYEAEFEPVDDDGIEELDEPIKSIEEVTTQTDGNETN